MRFLWLALALAGCATTKAPAPAVELTPEEQAAQDEARTQAWIEAHRDTLHQLVAKAEALDGAKDRILDTTTSWRVDPAVLETAQRDCPGVLTELTSLAESVDAHMADGGFDALPLLPSGWNSAAAIGAHRKALGERCDAVPELMAQQERAEATKADALAAREALTKRTAKAAKAVAKADEVLRDIVGDGTFLAYLDALDGWSRAATVALRESRKPEPDADKLADARAGEAAAKAAYDARMAGVTLAISGRSSELTDAVDAAIKQLKKLKEDDRAAVLGLFPPEVTPASSILLQLIDQRM